MVYMDYNSRWEVVQQLNDYYYNKYGNYNYIFDDKISKELTEWETGISDEEYEYDLKKVLNNIKLGKSISGY